jgi:hypothetical protein
MSLKTIKVNPIFLSGGGSASSSKNKTRKEKPTGVSLNQSNSIKKKLIARIKNFQQNSNKVAEPSANQPLNDAFGDSVQFLDNLARDKEETKREKKNTSLKKKQMNGNNIHIATELPPELDWNTIMPKIIQAQAQQPQVQAQQPQVQQLVSAPLAPAPTQWQAPPPPSYGNLKKGTKPTYRTWLRTTQKQKPAPKQTINILEDMGTTIETEPIGTAQPSLGTAQPSLGTSQPSLGTAQTSLGPASLGPASLGKDTLKIINESTAFEPTAFEPTALEPTAFVLEPTAPGPAALAPVPGPAAPIAYVPSLKPKRKRVTRTLKYKLGKHANGTVSVLIKNSQTRRKVQTEQALLKQKSILDIKNHLRGNNLLKVGSNAPSDVLRHLYEQSILAGQIENKAKDTLIHNFFNEEKK